MTPSRKSIKAFLGGIRATIKAHVGGSALGLIRLLNPRIRGWVNYFRQLVSSRVFTKVDTAIFDTMVRWMRRRHPSKGLSWLRTHYIRRSATRNWIVTAPIGRADGSVSYFDLFRAGSVPIRRHIKVQAAATAFDPAFREYFRLLKTLRARAKSAEDVNTFRPSSRRQGARLPQPGRVKAAHPKA
jgi:RNA-directed DNA polymerase